MTLYEIISITLAIIMLLGGIVGVWIKTQMDIAELRARIKNIEVTNNKVEQDLMNLIETNRKENREDHSMIFDQLREIIKAKNNE